MSSENPFGEDAIKKSLDKLDKEPTDEANIGVVVEGGDVGITGSVSKDIGKPGGWDVSAEGTWMRRTGAKIAALLRWRG